MSLWRNRTLFTLGLQSPEWPRKHEGRTFLPGTFVHPYICPPGQVPPRELPLSSLTTTDIRNPSMCLKGRIEQNQLGQSNKVAGLTDVSAAACLGPYRH